MQHLQTTSTQLSSLLSHFPNNTSAYPLPIINMAFPGPTAPTVSQFTPRPFHHPLASIGNSERWEQLDPHRPLVPILSQPVVNPASVWPSSSSGPSPLYIASVPVPVQSNPCITAITTSDNNNAQDGRRAWHMIQFLDNTTITFTQDDVPDPPAVSFADDIPKLNSMWDDSPAHWGREAHLIINGHLIPLVYWPDAYRYGKKKQWQGTKAKWHEWKVNSIFFSESRSELNTFRCFLVRLLSNAGVKARLKSFGPLIRVRMVNILLSQLFAAYCVKSVSLKIRSSTRDSKWNMVPHSGRSLLTDVVGRHMS